MDSCCRVPKQGELKKDWRGVNPAVDGNTLLMMTTLIQTEIFYMRNRKGNSCEMKKRKKNKISNYRKIGNILLRHNVYLEKKCSESSLHGVSYLHNRKIHWLERLFWLASIMAANVSVIFLSKPLFERYLYSPSVMSVELDYFNWNISFPAITLCPHSKVDEERLEKLVNTFKEEERENVSTFISTIASLNLYTIGAYELTDHHLIPPKDYAKMAAMVYNDASKVQLTANTNEYVRIDSIMTEMGMCDVINSNIGQFDKPENWGKTVSLYKKSNIELNVHDGMFFIQTLNYSRSYTIYIHSPDDIFESTSLSYDHEGFSLISINIFIKGTKSPSTLRALSIQQRNCRYIDEPAIPRDAIYSYNRCIKECRITMIKALCDCVPHFYKPTGKERVCTLQELTCLVKFKKELQHLSVPMEIKNGYPKSNLAALPDSVRNCGCVQNCEEFVYVEDRVDITSGRLTLMRVGIDSYPRVRYNREIIFGFNDILVRVGGVMNLCLGMSVISVAEQVIFTLKPIFLAALNVLWKIK